jgi:UDP-GlcNAc3NAcA epimerase
MQIPNPKYNLKVNGLGHGAMTGQMMEKIEEILLIEKPEAVVIYGDTNSTIAGALTAKKLHIKVIHIEAGLRSFNMKMPEEVNRILTDRISDLLLCPTSSAIDNLKNEGFDELSNLVVNCGDIMKDAVVYYSHTSAEKSSIISDLNLVSNEFVLATIHRQENTEDIAKLKAIFEGLERISKTKQVVLPLHPRTKKILTDNALTYNLKFIEPIGYFDMLELLKNCNLVITDSGGLQKEAFFNKKNCIIAREETEWVELLDNGFARIVGSNSKDMMDAFEDFQNSTADFSIDLYGNDVGEKMHSEIVKLLNS